MGKWWGRGVRFNLVTALAARSKTRPSIAQSDTRGITMLPQFRRTPQQLGFFDPVVFESHFSFCLRVAWHWPQAPVGLAERHDVYCAHTAKLDRPHGFGGDVRRNRQLVDQLLGRKEPPL